MPTAGRDQRRAQRAETAQAWAAWLNAAMAARHLEPKDVIASAGGAIDKGSLSHWMNGTNPASPEGAVIVARVLDRDPVEALRAAGHDILAEAITETAERAYRERLAEMDKKIEAKTRPRRSGARVPQEASDQQSAAND